MFCHIISDSFCITELQICIDVHFYNTVTDSFSDFLQSRTRTSVEYKIYRLLSCSKFLLNIFLRIVKNFWSQFYVSWFVNTVYVSESRCNCEVVRNFLKDFVSVCYFFWLSVKLGAVHIRIVNTIFLTSGNS